MPSPLIKERALLCSASRNISKEFFRFVKRRSGKFRNFDAPWQKTLFSLLTTLLFSPVWTLLCERLSTPGLL